MNKGLIICIISGEYTLFDLDTKEIIIAKPRGVFRIKNLIPKVGDYVTYDKTKDNATITTISKRKNDLTRPVICNIDQAFIIFSVKEPDLNLNLLDRFLAVTEYTSIKPVIVFNKMDLVTDSIELTNLNEIIEYYHSLGYLVKRTSAKEKLIDQLDTMLTDKISVFTGQSGVGKSSLLNVIDCDLSLKTDQISQALGRGKHTTRHVELIHYKNGWVADTPGFGIMDFDEMTEVDLSHSFVEFFDASRMCKYNGCLHLNEPHCEVKIRVNEKKIRPSRYENYQLFIQEIKDKRKW